VVATAKKDQVMLTKDEQDLIINNVQTIMRVVASHKARVKRMEMSQQSARESYRKMFDKLRDTLKELG
jgi:hypothetical protein